MKIAILTIGDELLNGDLADSNTTTIARVLNQNSLPVSEAATVGDCEADIAATLQRLALVNDVVIVTGGLGPTDDDRTAKAAAKAFGRTLSLNDTALRQIRERFRSIRRPMHPRNEKQAMLPAKSRIIENLKGTAPGFHLQHDHADLYFTPGVPGEMLAMLDNDILPALQERFPDPPQQQRQTITVFGLAEPDVEARIMSHGLPPGVELAFNVEISMVYVKLRTCGDDAVKQVDRAELAVRNALDDYIVGYGDATLASTTAQLLITAGITVALAESCTGGLIAKLLTDQSGSSAFLERSIVTYANSAKTDCLNVSPEILNTCGAVSRECAAAMVEGLHATAKTTVSLAVTGIAGPDGGTADKPVGTVYLSMLSSEGKRIERLQFHGDRHQIRLRTAYTALDWLRRLAMARLSVISTEGEMR